MAGFVSRNFSINLLTVFLYLINFVKNGDVIMSCLLVNDKEISDLERLRNLRLRLRLLHNT